MPKIVPIVGLEIPRYIDHAVTELHARGLTDALPETREARGRYAEAYVRDRPPSPAAVSRRLMSDVRAGSITPEEAQDRIDQARRALEAFQDERSLITGAADRDRKLMWKTFTREVEDVFPRLQSEHAAALEAFTDASAKIPQTINTDRAAVRAEPKVAAAWRTASEAVERMGALQKLASDLRRNGALYVAGGRGWSGGFVPKDYMYRDLDRLPPPPARHEDKPHPVVAFRNRLPAGPALLSGHEIEAVVREQERDDARLAAINQRERDEAARTRKQSRRRVIVAI